MNVYDRGHELARALKESNEYKNFLAAKKVVDSEPETKKMVKEFLAKQMEIEYETMAGKRDQAKVEQLQKMYELLAYNTKARDFLDNYMRFQRMMADVYKILGDSVAEGMDFIVKE